MLISVVVPCYNEQEVLPMFHSKLTDVLGKMCQKEEGLDYEVLFADDGSADITLQKLRDLAKKDRHVKYISLSRNFGKEAAIYAGLEHSLGDFVVVMDADLQHPPMFLPQMYGYVRDGNYDCTAARRVNRAGESITRSWFAGLFYKLMNKYSDINLVDGSQDFRFMSRRMVDAVLSMKETRRFSKGIFSWVGFRTKYIEYPNTQRVAGKTSWSFKKLLAYSLDGICSFSTSPLNVPVVLGALMCIASVISFIIMVIYYAGSHEFMFGSLYYTVTLWAVINTVVLVGGIVTGCLGVVGQYISRTFMEVKNRPIYIAKEMNLKRINSDE
ncbi:MAG: glycosyltransferase family 2 protein [Oscillospiraceae bacterium]|jgi:glycosyltransferase involved in cell wall biosynthesis|nr:glycosyltransferase family 2 protein [Oscillospiraceae bacterium]